MSSMPKSGKKIPPENEFDEIVLTGPAENPFVSNEDDLGDFSVYWQNKSAAAVTEYTLLNVSDGPKTVLNVSFTGWRFETTGGVTEKIGPVTIDGNVVSRFPSTDSYYGETAGGNLYGQLNSLPFRYDSSLKIEWEHAGTGNNVTGWAFVLGSGPHSIAVVRDGEPVYMTAENLSEEQIDGMDVPDGYKIVRNPDISHEDPMNRGMWDDSEGEVVDHPYWKPFHDTLDKLDGMGGKAGSQAVIEKIEKNPTAFEGVLAGENPMEDPVEEAVQFWYERERERSPDLSELEEIRNL